MQQRSHQYASAFIYTLLAMTLAMNGAFGGTNEAEIEKKYEEAIQLYNRNKPEEAREKLRSLLEEEDEYLPALIMLGKLDYYDHKSPQAEDAFDRALSIDDYSIDALFWRARARMTQEDAEKQSEALSDLKLILERDSSHQEAWYAMGLLHERNGRMDQAIAAYRTALLQSTRTGLVHLQLGNVYEKAGLHEQADIHYRQALLFNPDAGLRDLIQRAREQRQSESTGDVPDADKSPSAPDQDA